MEKEFKKPGHNLQVKTHLLLGLNAVRTTELVVEVVTTIKTITDTQPFIDRIKKVDARRKDFREKAAEIIEEYELYVRNMMKNYPVNK